MRIRTSAETFSTAFASTEPRLLFPSMLVLLCSNHGATVVLSAVETFFQARAKALCLPDLCPAFMSQIAFPWSYS